MSGIAAIMRKDGGVPDPSWMTRMLASMANRGPDGSMAHTAGSGSLGHAMLSVAFNGLRSSSDGLAVSLDGRLDNREDLAASFTGIAPHDDAALLLACYRQWGVGCASRLEGDFAFVIWDPAAGKIFLGRDQIGIRPLYYHDGDGWFLAASDPAAILAVCPALARQVDKGVLGAFAQGEAHAADATVHPGIRRLPPGHDAQVTARSTTITRYFDWRIRPRGPGENPPEKFAELLTTAVRDRMVGDARVGALLSGGLDSSSIVAIAAREAAASGDGPLRTYSQVFPNDPKGDERAYIDTVIGASGLDPTLLTLDIVSPFGAFDAMLDAQTLPFIGPNLATSLTLHRAAAADGVRVVLDGHGGDESVSSGVEGLLDYAYRLRWLRLWNSLNKFPLAEGQSRIRRFIGLIKRAGPHRSKLIAQHDVTGPKPSWLAPSVPWPPAVSAVHRRGRQNHDAHLGHIIAPYYSQGLETLDRAAASSGIELRFPLLDRRLVQWCIEAPAEEKLADGYTRYLLRRGMSGLIPETIRWRRDKHNFAGHLVRGMVHADQDVANDVLKDADGLLRPYFDMDAVRDMWTRLQASPESWNGMEVQILWRAIALGLWLRRPR